MFKKWKADRVPSHELVYNIDIPRDDPRMTPSDGSTSRSRPSSTYGSVTVRRSRSSRSPLKKLRNLFRSGSTEEPVYSATTDAVAEFAYDHESRINHNPLFRCDDNDDEDNNDSKVNDGGCDYEEIERRSGGGGEYSYGAGEMQDLSSHFDGEIGSGLGLIGWKHQQGMKATSFRSPSPSPVYPATDEGENSAGIAEIPIPHQTQPDISDREEEEQEVSVEIDFREEEEEEEEGSAEIYSLESGDIIKRDVGSFRFRDSFHYRRSSSNFGSDSEDERPDIVTPAPESPSPPPPPLPTSPPPPKSELDNAAPPIDIIIREPSFESSDYPSPAIRGPSIDISASPPPPPPLELDVCEEEIVVFRDDAVRSGEVVTVSVEAHVEPEPRKKRQRFTRESSPLTVVDSAMGPRDNNDVDGISAIDEETERGVVMSGGGGGGEDPIRRSGAPGREVEETVADDIPAAKKSVRRKDSGATEKEKLAVKGSMKRGVKRTDSASSLKHQKSTDSNESDNAKSASSKSTTEDEVCGGSSKRSSLHRTDSERSSTKRKGKKISPPDSTPDIAGILEVTLSPQSRWRRRYITVQSGQLFIFPKPESKFATARVRLDHHGLHGAAEETGERHAIKLTRRKAKVTLYLKADTVAEFGGWTRTLTSEIRRLSSSSSTAAGVAAAVENVQDDSEDLQDIGATEVPAGIDRVAVVEQEEGEDHSILDLSSLQPFSLGDSGRKQQQQQQQQPAPTPRSKETNEQEDDGAAESETSVAGCAPISRTSSAAVLPMETDFPALEVRQLDEEPVRRRRNQLIMDEEGDRVYQATAVTVEDDSDDNIPDEWKQSSVDSPTTPSAAKTIAVQGVRRDSSSENADDDDDDNAMMSVIEEVPEEGDSLIENTVPTRRASHDLSSASSGTEDSSNTGSNTDSSAIEVKRVSPVASNDSGVVDGHHREAADLMDDEDDDEDYNPSLTPSPPLRRVTRSSTLGNPNNVSVRNIAKFWEDVSKAEGGGGGIALDGAAERSSTGDGSEEGKLNKKWFSMPDLDEKKKRAMEREEEEARLRAEEEERARREEEEEEEAERAASESANPDLVRWDDNEDDRDVCGTVPIRERMRMFKTMEAKASKEQAKKQKMSKWFSMPSLDEPWNRNGYKGKRYDYSRTRSQMGTAAATPNAMTTSAATPPASMAATAVSPSEVPIPLVSSESKENEDFELTPIRDRMRAFVESRQQPVSKPVISVPKMVSPQNRSRSCSQEPESMVSLADSVASSHTSGSTVISASKLNNYNASVSPGIPSGGAYSWQDESNGEIYNDRDAPVDKVDPEALYVVENGKEYPLASVSKRRSLFVSQEALDATPKLPKDILRGEPMINSGAAGSKSPAMAVVPAANSGSSCSEEEEDEEEEEYYGNAAAAAAAAAAEAVKSSRAKYIEEEQDVLANINLVKAMKQKFAR